MLTEHLMRSSAADCQYWETYLGMQCRLHELREKQRISVAAASKYLANLVYSFKGSGLSMVSLLYRHVSFYGINEDLGNNDCGVG